MVSKDVDQLALVFRLKESLDCPLGEFGEGRVSGSEDRERAVPLEGIDEASGLEGRREGVEGTGSDCGVNNVLGGSFLIGGCE